MKQLIFLLLGFILFISCQNQEPRKTSDSKPIEKKRTEHRKGAKEKKVVETIQTRSKNSTIKVIPPPKVYVDPDPLPEPRPYYYSEPIPEPLPEPLTEPLYAQEPEILAYAEIMPEFKGGNEKLMEFIKTNIRYPELCKELGVQGNVYVRMIIDQTGKVTQPIVVKAVDNSCGLEKEALRVIKLLPDFIPAENGRKKVSVYYHLPVRFRLD